MLLDKIASKQEQVRLALAAIHSRRLDLQDKESKVRELKKQYASKLHNLEKVDHGIEEATRLRKFMIHLDKTLSVIKRESLSVDKEKSIANEEFIRFEKERLKFEALKNRADEDYKRVLSRKEDVERDLLSSLRHTQKQQ